jgi:hypothetical protein
MSDSKKTKKELLAELAALRAQLDAGDASSSTEEETKREGSGLTRRDVLASAWVAPVILTVPLGASVVSPQAQAQVTTPAPTPISPTPPTPPAPPTPAPTAFPTAAPSVIPVELSEFEIS